MFPLYLSALLLLASTTPIRSSPVSSDCGCEGGVLVTVVVTAEVGATGAGQVVGSSVVTNPSTTSGPDASGLALAVESNPTQKTAASVTSTPVTVAQALGLAGNITITATVSPVPTSAATRSNATVTGVTGVNATFTTSGAATSAISGSGAPATSGATTSTTGGTTPSTTSGTTSGTTSSTTSGTDTSTTSGATTSGTSSSSSSSSTTSTSASTTSSTPSSTTSLSILPSPSKWSVIYQDGTSNITTDNLILDTSLIAGYNTYVLAFWTTYAPVMDPGTTGGPMDSIAAWTSLSDADRTAAKQKFHDADIRLTFTCFGGLDQRPAWTAADATAMGTEIAEFVQKYQFDGVDIDFEDFGYAQNSQPEAIVFLTTIFQTIRQALPRPYILSASVSPSWMVPGRLFSNMPGSVAAAVIDDLDYINGMYYYGGVGTWDTCPELTVASGNYQGCSTGEVMAQGIIPASKWLVGMPQFNTDGGNAFSDGVGTALGDCLKTVPTEYGGVGTWQYHPQYPAWIGNVRAAAGW